MTSKKIANLTKIIYNLNVTIDKYKNELQECHRDRKDLQNEIVEQNAECARLKVELERKQGDIELLTSKLDSLNADKVIEIAQLSCERDMLQEDVKKIKVAAQDNLEEDRKRNESRLQSLQQQYISLQFQFQDICGQNDKYNTQIIAMQDAHQKQIQNITEEGEKNIARLKSKHNIEMENLVSVMTDEHNQSLSLQERRFKNQADEIKNDITIDFKEKLKKLKAKSSHDLNNVLILNKDMESELKRLKVELINVQIALKTKDRTLSNLNISLQERLNASERELKETIYEMEAMKGRIITQNDTLIITQNKLRESEEKVLQIKTKYLDLQSAIATIGEDKKQTEDALKSVELSLKETKAIIKRNSFRLLSSLKEMTSILNTIRQERSLLKDLVYEYIEGVKYVVDKFHCAWEKSRFSSQQLINDIEQKHLNEISYLQSKMNDIVTNLEDKLLCCEKALSAKEQILRNEKEYHQKVKNDLTEQNIRISTETKALGTNLLESRRQITSLEQVIHVLSQKLDIMNKESLEYQMENNKVLSEMNNLRLELKHTHMEIRSIKKETKTEKELLELKIEMMKQKTNTIIDGKEQVIDSLKKNVLGFIIVLEHQIDERLDNEKTRIETKLDAFEEKLRQEIRHTYDHHQHVVKRITEESQENLKLISKKKAEVESQTDELQNTVKQMSESIAIYETKMKQLDESIANKEKNIQALVKQLKEYVTEKNKYESTLLNQQKTWVNKQIEYEQQIKEILNEKEKLEIHTMRLKSKWTERLSTLEDSISLELSAKINFQEKLGTARNNVTHLEGVVVALKEKINAKEKELDESEAQREIAIELLNSEYKSKEKEIMKSICHLDAKLKMTSSDLDSAEHKLAEKERKEDTSLQRIIKLETDLSQSLAREQQLKDQMVFYKNELKNREDNYNSIFSNRTKQTVGLLHSKKGKKKR